ncbi:MAG TPA: Glu-tRNA(Gln) amidotransferase subunit GatE [Candidatus Saccharimonadales bacterium]|nr:Glu-tRNA(Gln) amidotransferase subunit GatE [Candidatus Saccharimonadales bacterium]
MVDDQSIKAGLEVHRQLDTQHKLFCDCPTLLTELEPEQRFLRKLRPTQSELGQVDRAALSEFNRGKGILYESDHRTSCLVESDEEPPSTLNREAIEICLTAALLLKARPVDEIHVMRKIVIDGSNTTGFQRTCVIAMNGKIEVDGKTIPIDQISLEEDAARKTTQTRNITGYRIDRLGIPLIEVTTAPVLQSPTEVEKVALAIGNILRTTRSVKRGLGSVRQDLNISTPGGAIVEIKGVQELEILSRVVELEAKRQKALLEIMEELKKRDVHPESLKRNYVEVTDLFKETKARVFKEAISHNGVVLALGLSNFGGIIGKELIPGLRLGTEMSSQATFSTGIGGIFHSDELPAYGITQDELEKTKARLNLRPTDALVLVADDRTRALEALDAVVDRAKDAITRIPEETRNAMPDGTSKFIRPRPSAARMYPETDVPPTPITDALIRKLTSTLPEKPEATINQLITKYSLNQKLANQLVDSDYLELFKSIAATSNVQPSFIATFLTETCKSLKRDGVPVESVLDEKIQAMFKLVDAGEIAKETMPELMKWQAKNLQAEPTEAIRSLGLRMLTQTELDSIIDRHISKNQKLVEEKGAAAFPSIMGSIMSEIRGSADPKVVTERVKVKLTKGV